MKVYLSGPMTGLPEYNYPAFNAAAETLRKHGHEVVNPVEVCVSLNDQPAADWLDYMRLNIKALVDCQVIVMLPGYEESRGACVEKWIAENLGMQVFLFGDALLTTEFV